MIDRQNMVAGLYKADDAVKAVASNLMRLRRVPIHFHQSFGFQQM